MFINPVNSADLASYIKSTGLKSTSRISDRYDTYTQKLFIDKISDQPGYTPDAPILRSKKSFRYLYEKAKNSPDVNETGTVSTKKEKAGKDNSAGTKSVDAKGNGFVVTIPEDHIKMLNEYKTDLQHQVYELFNSSPDGYIGALVDVVA